VRLLLVRHGITQHNLNRQYTGQTDAPLSELGQQQAKAVGEYLAREKVDIIFSSDLQRARDTAREIARHHNLPVLEDPDLREISMGTWEGLTVEQIKARDLESWKYVRSDPVRHAPPGGESFVQLHERASRALQRCQEKYAGQTVLWATHGGLIGTAVCAALRLDLSYRHCFRHENTSVTELHFGDGLPSGDLPSVERLNDTAHLRALVEATVAS
jgi:broad specificity phosphatase PhoE